MTGIGRWAWWSAAVVLPPLALVLLLTDALPDPNWVGPQFHFYIVSFTSLLALGLAVLMVTAAGQLMDARVLFVGLAFMGLAGIFLTHALTTPGALVPGDNPWVGLSARLSLLVCAAFSALGTVAWPADMQAAIMRRKGRITGLFAAALAAYAVVAVSDALLHPSGVGAAAGAEYGEYGTAPTSRDPAAGLFAHLSSPAVSYVLTAVTFILLAIVIARYVRLYRLTRLPLVAGFLVSAIFLAQAQLSMTLAPAWHASWWEYHTLLLAGFSAACVGLVREYARGGSLQDVVEGLFLHDTIAQLQRGYTEVIVALVAAVEARDPYTRGHTQRVAELAVLIGQELRLTPERLRTLHQSAMLHDIGKIGIPDQILNKPGPLTDDEFDVVKSHPERGYRIIKEVRSLQRELGGVRHHHERLDGSGYPDGLSGEAIPLEARIIAVADVLDALTSARSYRGPWPLSRALALLDDEAGRSLDPRCVEAVHRVLPIWSAVPSFEVEPAAATV
ncbi:MAG TPA: HD-GYP domain-containing protein [Thermomicrobiaceae bacterium]|nr:HD-GYP domain-containing protein [Thermomicrobiaceae bacterium]